MSVLLIGAAGQLGRELLHVWRDDPSLVVTTRSGEIDADVRVQPLDVSDLGAVRALIHEMRPSLVVNASAYTAVDRAESERDLAFRVNAEAPEAMADACAQVGARLVHYSTDYVFDGSGVAPYREGDPTSPLGVYGATKRQGEGAVESSSADYLILRTAWVYALHGHNFLRTMLRLGAERDELRVVDDQRGSPTPAWFIARATAHLLGLREPIRGTVNVVTKGDTTWHGFANAIFDEAHSMGLIARRPRVEAIPTSAYPTPAQRPAYSVLDTSRLRSTGLDVPDWRSALSETFARRRPT